MADTYTIVVPEVTAITLTPNPADINTYVAVNATITEVTKTLYPEPWYCGETMCGEF